MASQLTPIVTLAQGDEAPDLYITLQQDSTGSAFNLINRAVFAVIVESGNPTVYLEKWELEVVNETTGQVKLSWVKSFVDGSSYIDDLEPGKRYALQIFIGRTDLPPLQLVITALDPYFNGTYNYEGGEQEGYPVFKHATEDLYLSRSEYTSGSAGDKVWLVTSFAPVTWDLIKDQDKAVIVSGDLSEFAVWNYKQVHAADVEGTYSSNPQLDYPFEADPDYIITPTTKTTVDTIPYTLDITFFDPGGQTLTLADPLWQGKAEQPHWFLSTGPYSSITLASEGDYLGTPAWYIATSGIGTAPKTWARALDTVPPAPRLEVPPLDPEWYDEDFGVLPQPLGLAYGSVQVPDTYFIVDAFGATDSDIEGRGTQTVLTQIPLHIKTAYRLLDAN